MPQKLLFDISQLDPDKALFGIDEIRNVNPHRHEFEQLSGVLLLEPEEKLIVGLRDLRPDEFWTRGHIPGRPLFPGVLMLESAAQLCSFYFGKVVGTDGGFFGFGGIDDVRFRGLVQPGDRLFLVARGKTITPNRSQFETQGIVDGKVVFQATILGIRIPG